MTRPTRRGLAVAGVSAFAFVMAGLFGARALNAFVAPAVIALVVGAIQLRRTEPPRVERHTPEPGFPGEPRTVSLDIETERPTLATVEERVPEPLSPDRTTFETTLDTTLSYGIEPRRRGVYAIGPLTVAVTDTFKLFTREFRFSGTDPVVVYPAVESLSGPGRYDLGLLSEGGRDRQAFDRLREYERGDSLRDIHWKTSAKQVDEELIVKQFVADSDPDGVLLAAESDSRRADELANVAASLATYLLDSGVRVGLVLADEAVETGDGTNQRHALLSALARTEGGRVDDIDADVRIEVREEGIAVTAEDGRTTYDRLVGEAAA